ncbi:MAG: hypothetical protein GX339_08695 [Tissierellia bacterium]|nr:hypothetical protein [Tissierellia bacterium]
MRKRLFLVILTISVITSALTCVLTTYVYYGFYVSNTKEQLKTIVKITSEPEKWSDLDTIQLTVNDILKSVNYNMRFTIIENDGNVTYDSWTDEIIENHRDRPEVDEAFQRGFGENTRYSDTISSDMYYYAVKLNDGQVLRLSREISSMNKIFTGILPLLFVLFIFILLMVYVLASIIAGRILKPINRMTRSLDDMLEGESKVHITIYEELEPLSNTIKEQKDKINQYINELKYERDTISFITENMKEGFILLNRNKNILSINKSGKIMVGNRKFSIEGNRNILELTRNPKIIEKVDTAYREKEHLTYDIATSTKHYRYYLSPVTEGTTVKGLLILIEDITMQKKAEIMRKEFSANVSHELKTPLTTIVGFAEMIKEGLIKDNENFKKYGAMIYKEGMRLISLVEDLMRLSKIEEGVQTAEREIVNIKEICQEVVALLHTKAEKHHVKIDLNLDNVEMCGNRNYISELLYNLIDNGIKYNKKGGNIKVNIYQDDYINISIADTGVGIPAEHRERIFERFYRVDKSRFKETGGTGLGLSIVKHITELYKGSIAINSSVNKGTTISIKFPLV